MTVLEWVREHPVETLLVGIAISIVVLAVFTAWISVIVEAVAEGIAP